MVLSAEACLSCCRSQFDQYTLKRWATEPALVSSTHPGPARQVPNQSISQLDKPVAQLTACVSGHCARATTHALMTCMPFMQAQSVARCRIDRSSTAIVLPILGQHNSLRCTEMDIVKCPCRRSLYCGTVLRYVNWLPAPPSMHEQATLESSQAPPITCADPMRRASRMHDARWCREGVWVLGTICVGRSYMRACGNGELRPVPGRAAAAASYRSSGCGRDWMDAGVDEVGEGSLE